MTNERRRIGDDTIWLEQEPVDRNVNLYVGETLEDMVARIRVDHRTRTVGID